MGCGCEGRKEWLNARKPGLGDKTEQVIKKGVQTMPEMLRPTTDRIVWLLIGAIVVPMILRKVR